MSEAGELHRLVDQERSRFIQELVSGALAPAFEQFQKETSAELQAARDSLKAGREDLKKGTGELNNMLSRRLESIEEAVQDHLLESIDERLQETTEQVRTLLESAAERASQSCQQTQAKISDKLAAQVEGLDSGARDRHQALVVEQSGRFDRMDETLVAGQNSLREGAGAHRAQLESCFKLEIAEFRSWMVAAAQTQQVRSRESFDGLTTRLDALEERALAMGDEIAKLNALVLEQHVRTVRMSHDAATGLMERVARSQLENRILLALGFSLLLVLILVL